METYSHKVLRFLAEGKFIRHSIKRLGEEADRYLGVIARKVLFRNAEIQKNKVFFMTFQGDYTCNPKYICDELIRQGINCDIIWGVRLATLNKAFELPKQIRLVNRFTLDFYEEMATSKIWIINSVEVFKNPIYKKKDQILIETWHGSLGIKRFDKQVNDGRAWVKAAELCGKMANYCISNSEFEDNVYRGTFWSKNEILQYGHPRNDILFLKGERQNRIISKIKEQYEGIEDGEKYILYGPTFRDSHNFDCYSVNYERLISEVEKKFGGKWKVLVRFHPTVRKFSKNILSKNEQVIDVTDYPDIQELMLLADIAITDYSSWIYDFVLTRKPGFIFATDLEQYNDERGFYYKLETTPFAIARSNKELIANIRSFDLEMYQKKVEAFLKDKGCVEDGQASKRVVEKIREIIGDKK